MSFTRTMAQCHLPENLSIQGCDSVRN